MTLNLTSGSYKPYMKPNNKLLYVHRQSNHPPALLKSILQNINKRLTNISHNKEVFDDTIEPYQKAVKESAYDHKLTFNPEKKQTKEKEPKKKHHMVQPSVGLECKDETWKEVPGHHRQMLPLKPPVAQDLQQTHTQTQLLVHAKHESHHLVPQ